MPIPKNLVRTLADVAALGVVFGTGYLWLVVG